MSSSQIDYGQLVQRALRRVVHDALALVAERGLPGRHQLYLTFRTDHPGVELDEVLRARYPNEMTIVLQYEFWELEVDDDRFAVTLSFNDVPHRLAIPFDAVSVFADPSVEFGLQFTMPTAEQAGERARPGPKPPAPAPEAAPPAPVSTPEDAETPPEGGAEVVALDRFRKKR